MIPNAEQLRAISQMTRGDLGEIRFPVLLHALAVHTRTVVLSIERRQLKKEIILENGIPVDCHSNLLQDTLGKFMVARGAINDAQNHDTLSKSATTGKPFTDIIVADGLVNASELYKILQQNLAKKLLDAFSWRSGMFHVSADLPPVDSPLKVRAPQLVLTGISKFAPEDEIAAEIEALRGEKKILINPRPPFPLKELRLSKDHKEIVGLVSVGKTLDELEAESGLEKARVLRALYALAVIGVALPEDWLLTVDAPLDMDFATRTQELSVDTSQTLRAVGGAAIAVEAAEKSMTAQDIEKLRNELMEVYLRYRKQDAFELLGIDAEATREQVEQGYLQFSERFAPWKFEQPGLEIFADKARDLFIAGGQAFGELCNPETRKTRSSRAAAVPSRSTRPSPKKLATPSRSNLTCSIRKRSSERGSSSWKPENLRRLSSCCSSLMTASPKIATTAPSSPFAATGRTRKSKNPAPFKSATRPSASTRNVDSRSATRG